MVNKEKLEKNKEKLFMARDAVSREKQSVLTAEMRVLEAGIELERAMKREELATHQYVTLVHSMLGETTNIEELQF